MKSQFEYEQDITAYKVYREEYKNKQKEKTSFDAPPKTFKEFAGYNLEIRATSDGVEYHEV